MTDPSKKRRTELIPPVERDVSQELEFHLEMTTAELIDQGWDATEARQEAQRRFGDYNATARNCRQLERERRRRTQRADYLDELRQDVRYALRGLLDQPRFTLVALTMLALGIGAIATFFALCNSILLEPLSYPDSERLVTLREINESGGTPDVSWPNFVDWRERSRSFTYMAGYQGGGTMTVQTPDGPASVGGPAMITRDFFQLLGIAPERGRVTEPGDHRLGAPGVAVVSRRLWHSALGGRPLDEELQIEVRGRLFQVIGVMPPQARLPLGADVWIPKELWTDTSGRTGHNWDVIARLADEASLSSARAEMSSVASVLADEYAGDNDAVDVRISALKGDLVGDSKRPLLLLLAAAAVLLLIAGTNLATNLLAKAVSRQREIAIRAALGAGRARVVRQLVTETTLLTLLGGALGLALTAGALTLLRRWQPTELPRLYDTAIDGWVVLFASIVSLGVGLLFGLVPALHATRRDLAAAIQEGVHLGGGGQRQRTWRWLVGAQVALALILLIGAGLLLRSLSLLVDTRPGFETADRLAVALSPPRRDLPPEAEMDDYLAVEADLESYLTEMLEVARTVPGVEAAGLTSHLPFTSFSPSGTFYLEETGVEAPAYANYRTVSDGYFEAMGIPLIAGRTFEERDRPGSVPVAVIDSELAQRYWPDSNPIGRRVQYIGMDLHGEEWMEIVGVVGPVVHRSLADSPRPTFYVALRQRAFRAGAPHLVVHTGSPEATAPTLRRSLSEHDPRQLIQVDALASYLGASTRSRRFGLAVLAGFAGVALLLSLVGIYGVAAYAANERHREVGIRLALGAARRHIVASLVGNTVVTVAIGLAVGVLAALLLGRFVSSLLHGIQPGDPPTLVSAVLLLGGAAILASWLPARRSARQSPSRVLRDG